MLANNNSTHDDLRETLKCPVCSKMLSSPIYQCQSGHSLCGTCVLARRIKRCITPACVAPVRRGVRNLQLEAVLSSLPSVAAGAATTAATTPVVDILLNSSKTAQHAITPCPNTVRGCKWHPPSTAAAAAAAADTDASAETARQLHVRQCRHALFVCEGLTFAQWPCTWTGTFSNIIEHFSDKHAVGGATPRLDYKAAFNLRVRLNAKRAHRDIRPISFFEGRQVFWYKHQVDPKERKVYWAFQLIGDQEHAQRYFYEFEVCQGDIRKYKVTEVCQSHATDVAKIFAEERCVVMSFAAVRSYQNAQQELDIKFRIMKVKHTCHHQPPQQPSREHSRPPHARAKSTLR